MSMNAELSRWWRYGVLTVALAGLGVLLWITLNTYSGGVGTPIPTRVVDPAGRIVFTGADIIAGQQAFQKHGLMENGSIWGHGAYFGPDFSAAYLHQLALATPDPASLQANRYDSKSGTLGFTAPEAASYRGQIELWRKYFDGSTASRGLAAKSVTDPEERRVLVAFFAWTAWGSAAHMPGQDLSTMIRHRLKPVILLLNNDGYTIERVISDQTYNDLQPWLYHQLVTVFGGGLGLDVRTEGELEDALEKAGTTDGLVFIEIHTARLDCPDSLRSAGRSMAKANQI